MLDLFRNHIVGFLMRRLILFRRCSLVMKMKKKKEKVVATFMQENQVAIAVYCKLDN